MQDVILVIDNQESIQRLLENSLGSKRRQVIASEYPEDLQTSLEMADPSLLILDITGREDELDTTLEQVFKADSRLPVILLSSLADLDLGMRAMKAGVCDFVSKPISMEKLAGSVEAILDYNRSETELLEQHRKFRTGSGLSFYKLQSQAMTEVYEQSAQVAMSRDTTVLITGESGTGKEIIARLIHDLSPRRDKPFLELNCASIPSELLENELFGHEVGAFTDAREAKIGLVEVAKGGTLFLDEIGEMSLALQVKLLRFHENKIFRRVGGTKDMQVDVRIVSATNQDLHEQVAHKRFRADLFYRLNVVPIRILPLRERREDILPLIQFFGKDYVGRFNRRSMDLNEEARRILMEYDWPGNVRELKNLVERMVLMDTGDQIGPESLRMALGQNLALSSETPGERIRRIMEEPLPESGVDLEEIVKSLEVDLIEKALNKSEGNQSRSAALLGLGRDKLRYRLKSYGIGKEE